MYATNTRSPRQFHSNNFHWVNEPNCLHRANYYLRSLQFLNYSENSCPVEPATPPRGHRLVPQWCCCQSLPVLLLQLQHWLLGRSVLQVCRYHNGVCMCVCILYVHTCVCMFVCIYVLCTYVFVYVRMYIVCIYVRIYVYRGMLVCIHICMCLCKYVYMYLCVCMYACTYVCMYVCMCVCVCVCAVKDSN